MRNVTRYMATIVILAAVGALAGSARAQDLPASPATPSGPARAQNQPASPAPAQAAATPLTLDAAIDLALKASHRIAEGKAREDAAAANVAGRSSAAMPIVSLVGGYTRTNHVDQFAILFPGQPAHVIYPDIPDNWRSRVDVQWPVYTSGRVQALERAAAAEQQATGVDVSTTRADVTLDTARAYWTLMTAIESVKVVENSLKLVEAHLSDVRALRAAGLLAPNDVLSAEAIKARQEVVLVQARNARDVAEADLHRITGLGQSTPISLDGGLEAPPPIVPPFNELIADARKNRTERQALQLRVDSFGQQRAAAAAESKPVVSVGAGVDYSRPNQRIFPRAGAWNESWDIGFNVAWTVWDGGRAKADVAQANAIARAAVERLAEFDTMLEFEVRQRELDLKAAVAAITAATQEVTSAAEARRVVGERFKAGLASNTDVLDAQGELINARLGRTQALAAQRLAEARLRRAIGK